jgi:hypothetical protein
MEQLWQKILSLIATIHQSLNDSTGMQEESQLHRSSLCVPAFNRKKVLFGCTTTAVQIYLEGTYIAFTQFLAIVPYTQQVGTLFLFKYIWIRPQRPQGCQKTRQDPLNMPFEVWCANIAPKLKNIQKSLGKQVFFWKFCPILMVFQRLCLSGAILAQKLNTFIFEK